MKFGKQILLSSLLVSLLVSGCDTNAKKTSSSDTSSSNNIVAGFELNKNVLVLEVLESEKLEVVDSTATPTWSSSDIAIATVDGAGIVTAISIGSVVITADIAGETATCDVRVDEAGLRTAKSTAGELLDAIMAGETPINTTGASQYVFEEWYTGVNWLLAENLVSSAKEAILLASSIAEVNNIVSNLRSTEKGNSSSLYNIVQLTVSEYKIVAKAAIDDFITRLDPKDYLDDFWEGIITYFDEVKVSIDNLSGGDNSLANIKKLKDDGINRIINESLTKLRMINWWGIGEDYNVEDLMNDLAGGVTTGIDGAVAYFMALPAFLLLEEDYDLYDYFIEEYSLIYATEITLAINYFAAMSSGAVKNYFIGQIYHEMLYLMGINGLSVASGADKEDVSNVFTTERTFFAGTDKEFTSAVYSNEDAITFSSMAADFDVSVLTNFKNIKGNFQNFIAEYAMLLIDGIYEFWQINWATDIIKDITFHLDGGNIDGETGPIVVQLRFRDLDIAMEETEDYRGTYYIPDQGFYGYEEFFDLFDTTPVRDDIEFLGWVDADGIAPRWETYFDYVMRDDALADTLAKIHASWNIKNTLEGNPIVGIWKDHTGYNTYTINEDGTWNNGMFEGFIQEKIGIGYDLIKTNWGGGSQGFIQYISEGENAGKIFYQGANEFNKGYWTKTA